MSRDRLATALVGRLGRGDDVGSSTPIWVWTTIPRRWRVGRWLHDYTAELFDGGLPWCPGAREMLEALAAERVPMALVTNTSGN